MSYLRYSVGLAPKSYYTKDPEMSDTASAVKCPEGLVLKNCYLTGPSRSGLNNSVEQQEIGLEVLGCLVAERESCSRQGASIPHR